MRKFWHLAAITALTWSCGVAPPAQAEAFRVGRLLCWSTPRVGLVLGSAQSLRCTFYRRHPQRTYIYEGRIRRVGLDIGVTSAGTLSWVVFARNSRIGPGTLRGQYVGASGNVALGPGLGANVLIGGSRRSVMLQPLSIERSIGLNLAAGVTNLTLGPRGRG
ncbi:DUF992 domain-containing protein [Bradyrhizobium arachidis]|jgi:hypothetical protein|uniref:DUF992 domain-containing protein n=1 Tax=Bradyrhizobium arachidis TaxID=858423 RepID=A0AAE7THB5_9BRAD|nr:DUF992 domain-containing protein [Bradyrhizobium arachidis]QOZ68064.1 DUF992 domain-containing protein [Bradyrhizobium arachidis]SFV13106.1 Protein of unknown function [Bradyrhizobium arachidis]